MQCQACYGLRRNIFTRVCYGRRGIVVCLVANSVRRGGASVLSLWWTTRCAAPGSTHPKGGVNDRRATRRG